MSQKRTRALPHDVHPAPVSGAPSAATDGVSIAGCNTLVMLVKETGGANNWTPKLYLYYPQTNSAGAAHGWVEYDPGAAVNDHGGSIAPVSAGASVAYTFSNIVGASRAYVQKSAGSGTAVCAIVALYDGGA